MAFTENLSLFFPQFGVDGTLDGQPVRVIFDAPTGQELPGSGMLAADPQVQIQTSQVPAQAYGLPLAIPQGNFTVREHLPDGTGMSLLTLQRAA